MFMTVSVLLQALALTSVISEICKLAHNNFFKNLFIYLFSLEMFLAFTCFQKSKYAQDCEKPVVGDCA